MGVTLTDVLLFGKAQSDDVDNATLVIYRRNIMRWSAIGGYLDIIVKGVSPLSLPDAIADSLTYVKAFGGTEQNGTPTPDTPVDIVSNNGVIKYGQYGKNLLDMSDDNIELGKYIDNSGSIGTAASNFYNKKHIPVVGGGTYTLSVSSGIRYASVMEYNASGTFIKRTLWGETSARFTQQTITLDSNTATVLIGSNVDAGGSAVTLERIHEIDWQFELGSTATPYEPYHFGIYTDGTVETIEDTIGNTATTEMLLKVGDYQDEQDIPAGVVTRKVGVKVLDGTENWTNKDQYNRVAITIGNMQNPANPRVLIGYCNYFENLHNSEPISSVIAGQFYFAATRSVYFHIAQNTTADFKQWLADQYAAGTPVIVIYPLATEIAESVPGQTLQVTDGDNTLEITQASLTGLELEAEYQAAVSLTIQEVQDANLDPNVEVTIN